jgi:hypothetical protein
MRWIKKPKVGTIRELKIVKRFLLFPTRINNEFRWLETAYIVKKRWYSFYETGWNYTAWTDKQHYERWKKHNDYAQCSNIMCQYNIDGDFCGLNGGAIMTNDGVCYSREDK